MEQISSRTREISFLRRLIGCFDLVLFRGVPRNKDHTRRSIDRSIAKQTLPSFYLISEPTSAARRMIDRAWALLIFLMFSLLIAKIKSPGFKQEQIDGSPIERTQHPLTPASTEASTTRSNWPKFCVIRISCSRWMGSGITSWLSSVSARPEDWELVESVGEAMREDCFDGWAEFGEARVMSFRKGGSSCSMIWMISRSSSSVVIGEWAVAWTGFRWISDEERRTFFWFSSLLKSA